MFEALRRMIFPIIIIVLLCFGGLIILEWGLGFSQRQDFVDANIAGVVNGETVSWQEYNEIYQNMYQQAMAEATQENEEIDELPEPKLEEIRQEAWKQLVQNKLIMQEVEKANLVVADEELYSYLRYSPPPMLQSLPAFQTEGKFDYQKYVNTLADPQAASFWAQIESLMRGDVARMKLQEMVIQTAHVTENEIRQWFMGANEKVKVGMVDVNFKRFSSPPPQNTEEEMRAFFEEHRDDYPIEERAALNIVMIEKKPAPADWEASFQKAKAIHDSIVEGGADFTEMVERYSEDPSAAQNQGDLGWFPRGQMVEEFDRYVFQMKEGDVSDPIRTQFGWHVIKCHGFKEEREVPRGKKEEELVEKVHASHILIKTSHSQETLDKAYRKIEEFQIAAKRDGFFKAAEDVGLPVRTSGSFFRGRNIQYLGNDPKAGLFAFNNEVDAISNIFENNSAIYCVQVADKKPADMATFEEAEEKVNLDLLQHKVRSTCRDTAEAIMAEVEQGASLKEAAKRHGEEYDTPDPFGRSAYVAGIRRDPMAIGAAFSLDEKGEMTEPVDHEQGVAIFELLDRESPDLTEFQEKRDSVHNVILMNKRQELYARWMDYMVNNSDIESYVDDYFMDRAGTI